MEAFGLALCCEVTDIESILFPGQYEETDTQKVVVPSHFV